MKKNKIKKSFKKVVIRFAFVFLLVILLLTFFSKTINQMLLPQVTLYTPSSKNISNTTMFTGSILYEDAQKLYPEYGYFIDEVLITENTYLTIGMPIAKLREDDVAAAKESYEIDILTLESNIQSYEDQLSSGYTNKTQKEAIQRQLDILNIQLDSLIDSQEKYFSLIDESNNLISTVEGDILALYLHDRSYIFETDIMLEYADDNTKPIIQWEMSADVASQYSQSSRVSIDYSYVDTSDGEQRTSLSSMSLEVDKKEYSYQNQVYLYTVYIPEKGSKILNAFKLDITLSDRIASLENAIPKNTLIKDSDTTGIIYLLKNDDATGKYSVEQINVSITGETDAYYGVDYDFQKNDQIILSSTKTLSDGAEVRLR